MTGDHDEPVVTETTPDGITVVRLQGAVDDDSAPALTRTLIDAAAHGSSRTVIDLSGLSFADSSVLHALLGARKAHAAAGKKLVLAGPLHLAISRLFEVTNTGPAFQWADSLQAGMTC
ncbi:STAS domain-containing protein [Streptomyces goshikiensis]|uniref:STAS domain-containing protein n=1 Tax=Streptomyces goshikiensis TaxID=1942 RepID=UPI0036856E75